MLSKTFSFGLSGLEAYLITIEADKGRGLPSISVIGLPDNAVKESRDRVKSALRNSGFDWPTGRITINLAPADTRKEGPAFDLAIALSVLAADEKIPLLCLEQYAFLGELSLSGLIKPVSGVLPAAMAASRVSGLKGLVVPTANVPEAALASNVPVRGFDSLNQVAAFLTRSEDTEHQADIPAPPTPDQQLPTITDRTRLPDLSEVKGQARAKRALEVAAAGGHNILLIGPPGGGKTMLARRLPGILPALNRNESLDVTRIMSSVGLIRPGTGLITQRPFRNPHHSASHIALIGGGSEPRPGEITLAHHGVLFLDEFPEFSRASLEALRQPLEEGEVLVSRAARSVRFPAGFMLIAAMNPCPCGRFGDHKRSCRCKDEDIHRYRHRISGPLMERIDIHLELPALNTCELMDLPPGESSGHIALRVQTARRIQTDRYPEDHSILNSRLGSRAIREFCALDKNCRELLKQAVNELGLSARAHDKVLKVARTVSDLAGCEDIRAEHLAEAIGYRCLDKTNF